MSDLKNAQSLLKLAYRDLNNLSGNITQSTIDDYAFGFFAQQAVEKATKCWLSLLGVQYPKSHDIALLFRLLTKNGVEISALFQDLIDLTDFAVEFRYDPDIDFEDQFDRTEIFNKVKAFIQHIERHLTERL